jgi:hypothetical protein
MKDIRGQLPGCGYLDANVVRAILVILVRDLLSQF